MTAEPVIIWHNPRCSKSRGALRILEERGVPHEVRLYLEHPPSVAEIEEVMAKLGITDPRQMMRKKEPEYRELGLQDADRAQLIRAMAEHPRLIERPILIREDRAIIARPPELAEDFLAA